MRKSLRWKDFCFNLEINWIFVLFRLIKLHWKERGSSNNVFLFWLFQVFWKQKGIRKLERAIYIYIWFLCVIFFRSNSHFSPLSFPNVDDHQGPSNSNSNTGRSAVSLRPQLPSASHRTSLRTSSALSAASDYDSENEGDDERTITDP